MTKDDAKGTRDAERLLEKLARADAKAQKEYDTKTAKQRK